MEILIYCLSVICLTIILGFYFIIIKPFQDEKAKKRRKKLPTWKEIDLLFSEDDAIIKAERKG